MTFKKYILIGLTVLGLLGLSGCGSDSSGEEEAVPVDTLTYSLSEAFPTSNATVTYDSSTYQKLTLDSVTTSVTRELTSDGFWTYTIADDSSEIKMGVVSNSTSSHDGEFMIKYSGYEYYFADSQTMGANSFNTIDTVTFETGSYTSPVFRMRIYNSATTYYSTADIADLDLVQLWGYKSSITGTNIIKISYQVSLGLTYMEIYDDSGSLVFKLSLASS